MILYYVCVFVCVCVAEFLTFRVCLFLESFILYVSVTDRWSFFFKMGHTGKNTNEKGENKTEKRGRRPFCRNLQKHTNDQKADFIFGPKNGTSGKVAVVASANRSGDVVTEAKLRASKQSFTFVGFGSQLYWTSCQTYCT